MAAVQNEVLSSPHYLVQGPFAGVPQLCRILEKWLGLTLIFCFVSRWSHCLSLFMIRGLFFQWGEVISDLYSKEFIANLSPLSLCCTVTDKDGVYSQIATSKNHWSSASFSSSQHTVWLWMTRDGIVSIFKNHVCITFRYTCCCCCFFKVLQYWLY